ncbi:Catechol 1,2-dioxygenase 2 [Kluyvera intermedia]|nr:Catechol 1,2-dioxygenase 2 [Kluyvera intermedia]
MHFFVSAPGYKHLTTQINLNGDAYLWDDFAFATREELIADPIKVTDDALSQERKINQPHTEVGFNFTLVDSAQTEEETRIKRARVME